MNDRMVIGWDPDSGTSVPRVKFCSIVFSEISKVLRE